MSKYPAVVLFIVIIARAQCSCPFSAIRNLAVSRTPQGEMKQTKQSDCGLLSDYPAHCVALDSNLSDIISPIQNLESANADTLNSYFDQWCTPQCTEPVLEFYDCRGLSDWIDFLNNAYCVQINGRYCYSLWIDGVNNSSVVKSLTCGQDGSCSSTCQSTLQTTVDYLGCCARGLYDNPSFYFYTLINPSQFDTCDVDLGEVCDGAAPVGLGLTTFLVYMTAVVADLVL